MLFAKISSGKTDEDGFEAGLGGGDVAQAVRIGGGDYLGEEAVLDAGEDTKAALDDFHAGDAVDGGELSLEHAAIADAAHTEVVDDVSANAGFEGGGRVFDENFSVVDDGDAVTDCVRLFHVMGGEDYGNAFSAQSLDGVPHGDAALGIEAGTGLIEEEDLGMVGDGARDLKALSEAAAEGLGIGCGAVAEAKLVEQLSGSLSGNLFGHPEVSAMEVDIFEDGAGTIEGVVLRDDADDAAREGGMRDDVDARDLHGTGRGNCASGGNGDGGGFAGAVGAEQTVDQSSGHVKVDAVDGRHGILAAEDLAQP